MKYLGIGGIMLLIVLSTPLIVSIQLISAIQIEMNEEYSQQETLITKITGNFIDALSSSNIFFYKGHNRQPTEFTLLKIQDDYYVYAILSNKGPGNYSMNISGLQYKIATQVKNDDVIKNFTIKSDLADFYVVPGVIKTGEDFSLELTNLRDGAVEVEITSKNSSEEEGFFESLFGSGASTQTVTLSAGQTKKVAFEFDDSLNESTMKEITLASENITYSVPVYMETENKTGQEDVGELDFESPLLNISLATNSNTTRVIYLKNKADASVDNISIYVSDDLKPYVNLSITSLDNLDENSSIRIDLIISSGAVEDNVEGQITARYDGSENNELFAYSSILLNFVEDYVPTGDDIVVINTKTCGELNGTVCGQNQTCSGEQVYAQNGNCCLAQCQSPGESGSTGKYIGWGLVILIVLFLGWFFMKKYKKVNNPIDLIREAQPKK